MKQNSLLRSIYYLALPLWDPVRMARIFLAYPGYVRDVLRYRRLPGAESRSQWHFRPILDDKTSTSGFDAHYVYLGAWAFRHIATRRLAQHVDVGSQIGWVTCVAGMVGTVYFALPIGRQQIVFNAHRVHRPSEIVSLFGEAGLTLRQFSAVDDGGQFHAQAEVTSLEQADYACGMFHFIRA